MFIEVKLLQECPKSLYYSAPDEWNTQHIIGRIVKVPLKKAYVSAIVVNTFNARPSNSMSYTLKNVQELEPFPDDNYYMQFTAALAHYHQLDPLYCIKRMRHFIQEKEQDIDVQHSCNIQCDTNNSVILTPEQQNIVDSLMPSIEQHTYAPALIHGVTGSGKTEVYKKLALGSLAHGKSVILLLPEVTLAMQFYKLLSQQLGNSVTIREFHSGTTAVEKKKTWQLLVHNVPMILVGVHLPIILPVAHLGLIIVDEEHDIGYQEKHYPKINTKEAAILRAYHYKIPIILGSATPSISSLHNVKIRGWKLFKLFNRYSGAFPKIKTVLLTQNKKRDNFWISKELQEAITDRLSKKEQIIIFLNRRGYSFFIQCSSCSEIPRCNACSVSLTLHEDNMLTCHYCGHKQIMPTSCPACKAKDNSLIKHGVGTQQIVKILQHMFPRAQIGRIDMDINTKKKIFKKTIADFESGELNILVGTQTITKGYHFPHVTLVGILWADINLHFPLYNASETTLQQLIQVSGRAGRQHTESLVIVQSMADHPIFAYLDEKKYCEFYHHEITSRKELGYPPCNRLLEIELKNSDETILEKDSQYLANMLSNFQDIGAKVLGPSRPPVDKVKHVYIRKIYIKGDVITDIISVLNILKISNFSSTIVYTPNPLH